MDSCTNKTGFLCPLPLVYGFNHQQRTWKDKLPTRVCICIPDHALHMCQIRAAGCKIDSCLSRHAHVHETQACVHEEHGVVNLAHQPQSSCTQQLGAHAPCAPFPGKQQPSQPEIFPFPFLCGAAIKSKLLCPQARVATNIPQPSCIMQALPYHVVIVCGALCPAIRQPRYKQGEQGALHT